MFKQSPLMIKQTSLKVKQTSLMSGQTSLNQQLMPVVLKLTSDNRTITHLWPQIEKSTVCPIKNTANKYFDKIN